jgi:aldose sugar dehydrogenase
VGTVFFFYLTNISNQQGPALQSPYDRSLKVELVAQGLSFPTSMAFINDKGILVLEKDKGTVRLVSVDDDSLLKKEEEPILKVNVNAKGERGLLGVDTIINNYSKNNHPTTEVFLYYTESDPLRNRIYKYQWDEERRFVNPQLILDLPTEPGPYHQGGKLKASPDNKFLYAAIGDLVSPNSKLQNYKNGKEPNDTSVILRISLDNSSSAADKNNNNDHNIFCYTNNTNDIEKGSNKHYCYYAYGIRNSFGLALDPITGHLWDTENGEDSYDEINLVKPGFNSGWIQVMGPINRNNNNNNDNNTIQANLVNFNHSHYADPVFSWKYQIGITDIEFLNSSKLGTKYRNNIFVGDINYGNLYYFKVNDSRTGIEIDPMSARSGLADLVAEDNSESSAILFGRNFGRITDIETGPDGFLYILSFENGKIYRIIPS